MVMVPKWECLGKYINRLSICIHKWDIPLPLLPYPAAVGHLLSLLAREVWFSSSLTSTPPFSKVGKEWGDVEVRKGKGETVFWFAPSGANRCSKLSLDYSNSNSSPHLLSNSTYNWGSPGRGKLPSWAGVLIKRPRPTPPQWCCVQFPFSSLLSEARGVGYLPVATQADLVSSRSARH